MNQAIYNIAVKPITFSRNPQANSTLERVHQTKGNIIRTFEVKDMVLDDENPWDGILASTMFHCVQQYGPQCSIPQHN